MGPSDGYKPANLSAPAPKQGSTGELESWLGLAANLAGAMTGKGAVGSDLVRLGAQRGQQRQENQERDDALRKKDELAGSVQNYLIPASESLNDSEATLVHDLSYTDPERAQATLMNFLEQKQQAGNRSQDSFFREFNEIQDAYNRRIRAAEGNATNARQQGRAALSEVGQIPEASLALASRAIKSYLNDNKSSKDAIADEATRLRIYAAAFKDFGLPYSDADLKTADAQLSKSFLDQGFFWDDVKPKGKQDFSGIDNLPGVKTVNEKLETFLKGNKDATTYEQEALALSNELNERTAPVIERFSSKLPKPKAGSKKGSGGPPASAPSATPSAPKTATNPQTGEKLQLVDGKWVPLKK